MNIFGVTIIDEVLQNESGVISVGEVAVSDKLTVKGSLGTGAFDIVNSSSTIGTFDLVTEQNNISSNTVHKNTISGNPHNVTASDVGINTADDILEGATNKYYTEALVSANVDVAANTAYRNVGHLPLSTGVSLTNNLTVETINPVYITKDSNSTTLENTSGSLRFSSSTGSSAFSIIQNASASQFINNSDGSMFFRTNALTKTLGLDILNSSNEIVLKGGDLNLDTNMIINGEIQDSSITHPDLTLDEIVEVDSVLKKLVSKPKKTGYNRTMIKSTDSLLYLPDEVTYSAGKIDALLLDVNNNADSRVLKSGDIMTGDLSIESIDCTLKLKNTGLNTDDASVVFHDATDKKRAEIFTDEVTNNLRVQSISDLPNTILQIECVDSVNIENSSSITLKNDSLLTNVPFSVSDRSSTGVNNVSTSIKFRDNAGLVASEINHNLLDVEFKNNASGDMFFYTSGSDMKLSGDSLVLTRADLDMNGNSIFGGVIADTSINDSTVTHSELLVSQIVHTDASKKLVSVNPNNGYNLPMVLDGEVTAGSDVNIYSGAKTQGLIDDVSNDLGTNYLPLIGGSLSGPLTLSTIAANQILETGIDGLITGVVKKDGYNLDLDLVSPSINSLYSSQVISDKLLLKANLSGADFTGNITNSTWANNKILESGIGGLVIPTDKNSGYNLVKNDLGTSVNEIWSSDKINSEFVSVSGSKLSVDGSNNFTGTSLNLVSNVDNKITWKNTSDVIGFDETHTGLAHLFNSRENRNNGLVCFGNVGTKSAILRYDDNVFRISDINFNMVKSNPVVTLNNTDTGNTTIVINRNGVAESTIGKVGGSLRIGNNGSETIQIYTNTNLQNNGISIGVGSVSMVNTNLDLGSKTILNGTAELSKLTLFGSTGIDALIIPNGDVDISENVAIGSNLSISDTITISDSIDLSTNIDNFDITSKQVAFQIPNGTTYPFMTADDTPAIYNTNQFTSGNSNSEAWRLLQTGEVVGDVGYSIAYQAFTECNWNITTGAYGGAGSTVHTLGTYLGIWTEYTFVDAIELTGISINNWTTLGAPVDFIVFGSNDDGVTWTSLITIVGAVGWPVGSGHVQLIFPRDVGSVGAYNKFRLSVSRISQTTQLAMGRIRFKTVADLINTTNINTNLDVSKTLTVNNVLQDTKRDYITKLSWQGTQYLFNPTTTNVYEAFHPIATPITDSILIPIDDSSYTDNRNIIIGVGGSGYYQINGACSFSLAQNGDLVSTLAISKNASVYYCAQSVFNNKSSEPISVACSTIAYLNAGDSLRLEMKVTNAVDNLNIDGWCLAIHKLRLNV